MLNKITVDYKSCSNAKRDYSNFDEQRFVHGFSSLSMNFLHDSNRSLNSKFDVFHQNVSLYVDNHVPLKKMNKKEIKFNSKPWINPRIQKLIKYRDKLLCRLKKKFSHQNEYLYKKFGNRVVNELRTSKIEYYKQYFTEHKSSMKMLWSGIKSIINIKNNRFYNISQIVQNGKVINNPRDMAQALIIILQTLLPK